MSKKKSIFWILDKHMKNPEKVKEVKEYIEALLKENEKAKLNQNK